MFEFLLAEWGLPPDYIAANWTDEMLALMVEKLNERKRLERGEPEPEQSEETFFRMAGIRHEVIRGDQSG